MKAEPHEYEACYPDGFWDEGGEYLRDCTILQHNDDYLEFLVNKVWDLNDPYRLIEFGCGAGKMGMKSILLIISNILRVRYLEGSFF